MKVRELMTQHPVCCYADDSAQSVARVLQDADIGFIPVIAHDDSGRLEGVITDRDLCSSIVAGGLDPQTTAIGGFITRDVVTCRAEQSLDSCEKLMQTHQIRRLPVIDERGSCVGIISQADLVRSESPEKVHRTIAAISKPTRTIVVAPLAS
jgi:CBS domain-containing protein